MVKKTHGPVSSNLILSLYESNKLIFIPKDVEDITGLKGKHLYRFIQQLINREVILRLRQGKYFIIPQEIGRESKYIGNWYLVAREIANSHLYYISHYSAMDLHNMLTQPLMKIYITSPKQERRKRRTIGNVPFEFIYQKREKIWGVQEIWITNTEKARVSELERTILDCLSKPKYSGGILEVVKGIGIQKEKINFSKLLDYIKKFNSNVVAKRMGYILEALRIGDANFINELKRYINNKYYILDPILTKNDSFKNDWKLIANISKDELFKVIQT
jgi:predicted transcriptional regulator of viral defense system